MIPQTLQGRAPPRTRMLVAVAALAATATAEQQQFPYDRWQYDVGATLHNYAVLK